MEKLSAIGMENAQRQMLQDMQRMVTSTDSIQETASPYRSVTNNGISTAPNISFSHVLEDALNKVNNIQVSASNKQTAVDMGISDDLSTTMLESQKASVAFSALVQVRNKLTTGLDDVMNTAL
ncbi:flagellar hook-basal body complex protein FliE [Serratia sp. M24T3]|uniref:flagellar hook-basal body complex protein FliE n=1 Tax=Serratia sp. M24T3 TaxID=932213 RepID=UPI00025BBCAB|nr:flagellar hook-basal body complex protein FliE [Serratia sp. M24T3]